MGASVSRHAEGLGEQIARTWMREEFDSLRFPSIAADALAAGGTRGLDADAIIDWVLDAAAIPEQADLDSGFGEPALTLYSHPFFRIEALFWSTGTTAVHEHHFSGAFTVLAGSSIQAIYTFDEIERVNDRFRLGRLAFDRATLLKPGDIEPILFGDRLIHAVFHLDCPSVTIVIRTHNVSAGSGPQLKYLRPGIALDPFFRDPLLTKKLQALDLLRATQSSRYPEAMAAACASGDLRTAFEVLDRAFSRRKAAPDVWQRVKSVALERHGARVLNLEQVLHEQAREALIISLRQKVKDPEHRFFLALLLNLPDRHSILELIQRRYPEEAPRTLVSRWARELSGQDLLGVSFDDLNQRLFDSALEGLDFERVVARLSATYGAAQVLDHRVALARQFERLQRSPVLRNLFVDQGEAGGALLPRRSATEVLAAR